MIIMKLSAPKAVTFWIAVIFAVLGLIACFFPATLGVAFVPLLIGFVLLALGNVLQGL
jgi:hypothetical protein